MRFLIFLFFCLVGVVHGLCGDETQLCDPSAVSCCNSTCDGPYDLVSIQFQKNGGFVCGSRASNTLILSPVLSDPEVVYQWLVVSKPSGSGKPVMVNADQPMAHIFFDTVGEYKVVLQVATPLCGEYFSTNTLTINVDDCCGNGLVEPHETCDTAILSNGCCDEHTCQRARPGHACPGVIRDLCTLDFQCTSGGECVSAQNVPFQVSVNKPSTLLDSTCSMDVQSFDYTFEISDPDHTPGFYQWNAHMISSHGTQHQLLSTHGSFSSIISLFDAVVLMKGTGTVQFVIVISDPCGYKQELNFVIERNCCGNSVLNTGEVCDDGNRVDGDYCNSACSAITGWCGDNIVQSNEMCDHGINLCCSPTCQALLPKTSICRPSYGDCDVPEHCTGFTSDCPEDRYANSSLLCAESLGPCDPPITCSGNHPFCPERMGPFPTSYMCRPPVGVCDLPEYCDGVSVTCPPDQYSISACRLQNGQCDITEFCSHLSPDCPEDLFLSDLTPCYTDGAGCHLGSCTGKYSHCVVVNSIGCQHPGTSLPLIKSDEEHFCVQSNCDSQYSCVTSVLENTCFIDGVCYDNRAINPGQPCQICDPSRSQTSWVSAVDGFPCNTLTPQYECSAEVDMCMQGVCVEQYLDSFSLCRESKGDCDVPEYCTGDSDFCPRDTFSPPTQVCREAEGECDAPETCTGHSPICPKNTLFTSLHVCRKAQGPCDKPEVCDGFSKDCPENQFLPDTTVCGESRGECDLIEMCPGDGPLCPEDRVAPADAMCREANGDCDAPEYCTGTGVKCPIDTYASTDTMCRIPKGLCDAPEFCPGNSKSCPLDQKLPRGSVCRVVEGVCDQPEFCDGKSNDCPEDLYAPPGTECRAPLGPCDKPEVCDGESLDCPEDEFMEEDFICHRSRGPCEFDVFCPGDDILCPDFIFKNTETTCRESMGDCDPEEKCPGNDFKCPVDLKHPSTYTCRTAPEVCDVPEKCDGVSDECPRDLFKPATHVCHPPEGPCDVPETCTGFSPLCPPNQLFDNTTYCRLPLTSCDLPELCDGFHSYCPIDFYAPSSTRCNPFNSQCARALNCTGASSKCPSTQMMTVGTPCEFDGLLCTTDKCNGAGGCATTSSACTCSTNADCVSDRICIAATCLNHRCQTNIVPNYCFIDGLCVPHLGQDPNNECRQCNTVISKTTWTPKNAGTPCTTFNPGDMCSGQDTCDGAGHCVDVQNVGQLCREAKSVCDLPEFCVKGNNFCPKDLFADPDTVCRESRGECDYPETCTGNSNTCPDDLVADAKKMCRPPLGLCDAPEFCDGMSDDCPEDLVYPETKICREIAGQCDLPDYCDGRNIFCPKDQVLPAGSMCRPARNACDKPEVCNGRSQLCPDDVLQPAGHVCARSGSPCELESVCDGKSEACGEQLPAPFTTISRPAQGPCDIADHCDGQSFDRGDEHFLPSSITCSRSTGTCGIPGKCSGRNALCPVETFANSSTPCRIAISVCDHTEYCDSQSSACPFDFKRPDGFSCSDGNVCNGDEVCQEGMCVHLVEEGGEKDCSDASTCTLDLCSHEINRCVHIPFAAIDEPCYTGHPETVNVGRCKPGITTCVDGDYAVCEGEVIPLDHEICGNGIDDNCNGLVDEDCHGKSCTSNEDCFTDSSCQTPQCSHITGKCVFPILPNYCFIDGVCYANQTKLDCNKCEPRASQYLWTVDLIADPSNGDICDGVESCVDGKLFTTNPLECGEVSDTCTTITCDPIQGCLREEASDATPCSFFYLSCSDQSFCLKGECKCTGSLSPLSSVYSHPNSSSSSSKRELKHPPTSMKIDVTSNVTDSSTSMTTVVIVSVSVFGGVIGIALVGCLFLNYSNPNGRMPVLSVGASSAWSKSRRTNPESKKKKKKPELKFL